MTLNISLTFLPPSCRFICQHPSSKLLSGCCNFQSRSHIRPFILKPWRYRLKGGKFSVDFQCVKNEQRHFFMKSAARSIHECFAQQTKLLILAFPRSLANLLCKSRQVIEMFCLDAECCSSCRMWP